METPKIRTPKGGGYMSERGWMSKRKNNKRESRLEGWCPPTTPITHTNCIEYLIDIYPFLCCKLLSAHHMKAAAERLLERPKLLVRVLQGSVTFAFWVVIHEEFFWSLDMSMCVCMLLACCVIISHSCFASKRKGLVVLYIKVVHITCCIPLTMAAALEPSIPCPLLTTCIGLAAPFSDMMGWMCEAEFTMLCVIEPNDKRGVIHFLRHDAYINSRPSRWFPALRISFLSFFNNTTWKTKLLL